MAKYEDVNFFHLQRFRDGAFDLADWQRFLENPKAWRRSEGDLYTLDVDYEISFDQKVKAGGYDWVSPDIKGGRCLVEGDGKKQFQAELIHLNRVASTSDVLAEAKARGLIRPSAEHLLAFGAQYPDVQREFPVVGLFEEKRCWRTSGGLLFVLCLFRDRSGRYLNLRWLGYEWLDHCRFLFLRNI